jgi:hypothetical protein
LRVEIENKSQLRLRFRVCCFGRFVPAQLCGKVRRSFDGDSAWIRGKAQVAGVQAAGYK